MGRQKTSFGSGRDGCPAQPEADWTAGAGRRLQQWRSLIEPEQKSTGFLDFGIGLNNPNLAAMVEAAGIHGILLQDPSEVEDGIARAFADDGPLRIDAVASRTELPMPPLHDEGKHERPVDDLAKTNLWR